MTKDIYVLQLNATLGRAFPISFTHHGGVPLSGREHSAMLLLDLSIMDRISPTVRWKKLIYRFSQA